MRAWLEIMRISNLPTVVSNAIAGAAIGAAAGWSAGDALPWYRGSGGLWWLVAAPPLAYIAGMILNDAFDAAIDARERPTRPIPSGRITRVQAFAAGFGLLACAIAAAQRANSQTALGCTVALAACVLAYNAIHARTAASVLLLAFSRALAAIIPMSAAFGEPFRWNLTTLTLPATLAAWTIVLSLLARGEVGGQPIGPRASVHVGHAVRAFFAAAFLCAVLGAAVRDERVPAQPLLWSAFAIVVLAALAAQRAWTRLVRDPRETPRSVGRFIVCLALIDAVFVIIAGDLATGAACVALAALADRAQRRIAGS